MRKKFGVKFKPTPRLFEKLNQITDGSRLKQHMILSLVGDMINRLGYDTAEKLLTIELQLVREMKNWRNDT